MTPCEAGTITPISKIRKLRLRRNSFPCSRSHHSDMIQSGPDASDRLWGLPSCPPPYSAVPTTASTDQVLCGRNTIVSESEELTSSQVGGNTWDPGLPSSCSLSSCTTDHRASIHFNLNGTFLYSWRSWCTSTSWLPPVPFEFILLNSEGPTLH